MTSIKEALEIVRCMIQGDQIESAIVDTDTMASLGDVVKAALAQLDSADAKERIEQILFDHIEVSDETLKAAGGVASICGIRKAADAILSTGLLPDASPGKPTAIVTCCVTGAIPGDGGACGDCDPCLMGETSVPDPVKRLIAEKNSLLQRIGELEDAVDAGPGNGAEKLARCGEPVTIKPLEWRDHRPDSFPEPAWSAQTPFGYYNIEEVSASDSPAYVVRLHAHHFVADKDSLEDAKAAAQADYERRIRSALVDSAALHSTSAAGETTSSDGVPGKQSASGVAAAPIETEDAEVAFSPSELLFYGLTDAVGLSVAIHSIGGGKIKHEFDRSNIKQLIDALRPKPLDVLALKEALDAAAKYIEQLCKYERDEATEDVLRDAYDAAIDKLSPEVKAAADTFQSRVQPWMMACFGPEISADRIERNHRFLEEALELVQSTGCTQSEAHQLVDYVYGRPVGETHQEIGGVMVTLAALCLALGDDMHKAGDTELARIWTMVEKIRAKQAAKPKHSPLPEVKAEGGRGEPVAIKPLEWDGSKAKCAFGIYSIGRIGNEWTLEFGRTYYDRFTALKTDVAPTFETALDAASAAAQADYEQRIRSALVVHPASQPDVEAIARAICKSRSCEGFSCCQWPAQGGRTNCPVKNGGYNDAARDAIAASVRRRAEDVMTIHYHGTPITPITALYELAGRHFCVSHAAPQDVARCHQIGQSVMLDNGAFSKWKSGKETNWAAFYEWCEQWLAYPTTWAVIPDVIDGGSQLQDAMIREWPFKQRGAPVWHMDEPVSRLCRLVDEWPKVCIGSTAEYAVVLSDEWKRRMDEVFNAVARKYLPWLHMLRGMQCVGRSWPFASVDSTDIAQNHHRTQNTPRSMADRWDAIQCKAVWEPQAQQLELSA